MTNRNNTTITCFAISGIVVVGSVALAMGYDGTLSALLVGAIAGLAGLALPQIKLSKD